jgi:two-component system NarL family response regulator
MNPEQIRILVVDDHFMMRVGIVGVITREADMEVAGEARNGQEAIDLFESLRPDVVLMDGILPDIHGIEATRHIVGRHPDAHIILISINETAEDIQRAMDAGATAYLSKASEQNEMIHAIRTVARGERFLPPNLQFLLAERNLFTPLSEREIEVLRWVAKGKSNKEIAALIGVGDGTVKTHLKHLMGKLGAPDRTRAVTMAMERGYFRL